jgi:large subunit ribosomal protein L32
MFRSRAFAIARAALAQSSRSTRVERQVPNAWIASPRWMSTTVSAFDSGMTTGGGARDGFVASRPPAGAAIRGPSTPDRPAYAIPEDGATRWDVIEDDAIGWTGSAEMDLMAVPKRKVTPSRKGKRNQFKRIKFVGDAVRCRDCGKVKKPHVYCDQCSTNVFEHGVDGEGSVPPVGKA